MPVLTIGPIRQTAAVCMTTDICRAQLVSFTRGLLTALLPDLQGSTVNLPAGLGAADVSCNSWQLLFSLIPVLSSV